MPSPSAPTPPHAPATPPLDRAYRAGVLLGLLAALAVFIASVKHRKAAEALPYVNIEILLDNSPSMNVGATPGDVAAMMYLTPCSAPGAEFHFGSHHFGSPHFGVSRGVSAAGQAYMAYACNAGGNSYDAPAPACPVRAARGVVDTPVMQPGFYSPRCATVTPAVIGVHRDFVTAGAPCAFACHWDVTRPAGTGNDYYGVARSTIGQPPCYEPGASPGGCTITLRSDFIKTAIHQALETMRDSNAAGASRFAAGVFTFDTSVHQIFPPARQCTQGGAGCAAGDDWAAALARVGLPPVAPDRTDTGFQPTFSSNGPATDLPKALTDLAHDHLTPAGTGRTPESPLKALVLITDGLEDSLHGNHRRYGAIDPAMCQIYKSMGIRLFVLYTPYIPQMNGFYLYNIKPIAEATGPASLAGEARQCATNPALDFIAADPTDPDAISSALQHFIARAGEAM